MSRSMAWKFMTGLSLLVSAYALALLVVPGVRPPLMVERFESQPLAVWLHLGASALAMGIGPFQFNDRLRARFRQVHRWMGRAYVTGVMMGGASGLVLATGSQGGVTGHVGFGLLAVLWMGTTGMAFARIRAGDVTGHRRWMTRSFALTFAAVTLRIYLPLSMALGLPYDASYAAIAWLCWVPNLIVAEWFFFGRVRSAMNRSTPAVS